MKLMERESKARSTGARPSRSGMKVGWASLDPGSMSNWILGTRSTWTYLCPRRVTLATSQGQNSPYWRDHLPVYFADYSWFHGICLRTWPAVFG